MENNEDGYRNIHDPSVTFCEAEIYYSYESRPGAANAVRLSDMQRASKELMYLETVIPTLMHMKTTEIRGVPAWGDGLQIIYLAAPSGAEWLYRLLNRQPDRLAEAGFRAGLSGRTGSSLADMEVAARCAIPCVLNRHGQADLAAREIVAAWGIG